MNQKKLYIGNLPYKTTEKDLRLLLRPYNPVHSIHIVCDKETARPRGFAFIDMDEPMAKDAMNDLNNAMFGGRNLRVNHANGVTAHGSDDLDLAANTNQARDMKDWSGGQVQGRDIGYDSNSSLSRYSNLELSEQCPYCNQYVKPSEPSRVL